MKQRVKREEESGRGGLLGSSPCPTSPSSFSPPALSSSSSSSPSSSSSSPSCLTSSSPPPCSDHSSALSSSSCSSSPSTSAFAFFTSSSSSSLSPDSSPSCRDLLSSPVRLSSSSSAALIEELGRDSHSSSSSSLYKTRPSQQTETEKKKSVETEEESKEHRPLRKEKAAPMTLSEAGVQAGREEEEVKSNMKKVGKKGWNAEKEESIFRNLDDLLGKCRAFVPELKKSNELLLRERNRHSQVEKGEKKERGEGEKGEEEKEEERDEKKKKKNEQETCCRVELLEAEEDKPYIELELHLGLFDVKGSIPSDEELRARNVSIVSTGVDLHAQDKALDESREDPVKFFLQQKELEQKLKTLYKGQRRFGERMIEGNEAEEIEGVDGLLSSSPLALRGSDQEDEESTESTRTKKKEKHLGHRSPSSSTTGRRNSSRRACLIEILSSGDESTDREDENE